MDYEKLTRAELLERLRALEAEPAHQEREQLIHNLEVHQVELETQNRELRETQQLLEESRVRYMDLYDFAPIAYCSLDRTGCIRKINLTGASLLGSERRPLLGKPFARFVAPQHTASFLNHMRAVATSGRQTTELTLGLKGRQPVDVELASTAAVDRDGIFVGCRTAISDISQRKQAEDVLRRAVRGRQNFLAVVAHDLRNPLNAILLGAEALQRTLVGPDEAKKANRRYLENIKGSVVRMNRLLADLLDLSSMDAGHLSIRRQISDVAELVAAVVEIMGPIAREKGLSLETTVPSEGLLAYCDRERILQVLLNLVGNALKFTSTGGSIRVLATPQPGVVLVAVKDTGLGIAWPQLARIFDAYWHEDKTQEKGTGLGLSIAKGIVELHGGKIWVDSRLQHGSTFYFTVPAAPEEKDQGPVGEPDRGATPPANSRQTPRNPEPPNPAAAGSARMILIVDDQLDARAALSLILQAEGFSVVTAGDGEEALTWLRQGGAKPSVILLDLAMPVMGGEQFLTARDQDPQLNQIPVILFSSQVSAQQTKQAWGLAGCLEKPLDIDKLFQLLAQFAR